MTGWTLYAHACVPAFATACCIYLFIASGTAGMWSPSFMQPETKSSLASASALVLELPSLPLGRDGIFFGSQGTWDVLVQPWPLITAISYTGYNTISYKVISV